MSSVAPQRSKEDGHGLAQQHPTSINFPNPPPPPDLTDKIIKIDDRFVAGGTFGDVYRCRYVHGSTSQEVAVKALRFKFTVDQDLKDKSTKMVRRELGVWKRLDHNNIVPFLGIAYGFGMHGSVSLVSSWMPNDTLHKFLAMHGDKLDVVHRLQILLDVSKGVDYLHSLPIVHGDLNTNNVLLDADYTARLADFGYASLVGSDIPEGLGYLQRTTAGPGALRWVAPEQFDVEESFIRTTKSDIYSFGCVALEGSSLVTYVKPILISLQVLSGKQPWSEVHGDACVIARLLRGYKPCRPESRTMDDSHWDFIQRCWSPLQERPSAGNTILSIHGFLKKYPPSGPLCDLFISPPSQVQDSDPSSRLTDTGVPTRAAPANEALITHAAPKADTSSMAPPTQSTYLRLGVWFFTFTRSLADLWNKVKRGLLSRPAMDITENDTVVFVVGPTGSGKSWFTNTATQCDLVKVSRDQHPLTSKVQAIRCELTDEAKKDLHEVKDIVFVDTPSFLTGYDNPDPHKEFKTWFDKTAYKPRHVGLIYVHRVETDPALKSIKDYLREFSNVCWISGIRAPQRLLVVVSYDKTSGSIAGSKIMQRISDLNDQVGLLREKWQPSSIHEELFQGEPEVAWRAVGELFRNL